MASRFHDVFPDPCALIGVVHLPPLPGSPEYGGSFADVREGALVDARALASGGATGLIVENFGDRPFFPGRVPSVTTAAMAVVILAIREVFSGPVGVNVLRNDAETAIGLAAVSGASFIRVNVLVGTAFTDQGVVEGKAHDVLRLRSQLAPQVAILADVAVKHATPPPGVTLEQMAEDTFFRGGADALIVTGRATGDPCPTDDLRRVRVAVPDAPLLVGSGMTRESAATFRDLTDGAIVGTSLKQVGLKSAGLKQAPVDAARVRSLLGAYRGK